MSSNTKKGTQFFTEHNFHDYEAETQLNAVKSHVFWDIGLDAIY